MVFGNYINIVDKDKITYNSILFTYYQIPSTYYQLPVISIYKHSHRNKIQRKFNSKNIGCQRYLSLAGFIKHLSSSCEAGYSYLASLQPYSKKCECDISNDKIMTFLSVQLNSKLRK